jgi:hypothetical protein
MARVPVLPLQKEASRMFNFFGGDELSRFNAGLLTSA